MITHLLERKVAEVIGMVRAHDLGEDIQARFAEKVKEAYLAGIEASEGCVPGEMQEIDARKWKNLPPLEIYGEGIKVGNNRCRAQTLSSLSKLKEEVVVEEV